MEVKVQDETMHRSYAVENCDRTNSRMPLYMFMFFFFCLRKEEYGCVVYDALMRCFYLEETLSAHELCENQRLWV